MERVIESNPIQTSVWRGDKLAAVLRSTRGGPDARDDYSPTSCPSQKQSNKGRMTRDGEPRG